ncbi:hypothetical protein BH23ACT2_BH23ACT2_15720 [soil metagenome]
MTEPQSRAGGLDANARGIAVLVVAVVVGFLLLLNAGGSGDAQAVTTDEPTETTGELSGTADGAADTTLPDDTAPDTLPDDQAPEGPRPPGEVRVIVLNGGGVAGAAGASTEALGGAGFELADPGNAAASPGVEATAVYHAEDFDDEATTVASVLGRPAEVVEPKPEEDLGPGSAEADVVVVLGQDAVPVEGE